MKLLIYMLLYITLLVLISIASAASWSGSVVTTGDTWSINRESQNITFSYSQSVSGTVSPVLGPGGRVLSPYGSYYEDVNENDVRLRERIAAQEGKYSSEELMYLYARTENPVNLTVSKPSGSDIYTINFYETWPVLLLAANKVEYSGKGINDRQFSGNNLDYFGLTSNYNREFSKQTNLGMSLERMNATILASDNQIFSAQKKATRDLELKLIAHTTGTTEIKYLQSGPQYEFKPVPEYEVLNQGEERFVGVYDLTKNIQMKSVFNYFNNTESWLPCCSGGWDDMLYFDQKGYSAQAIFGTT